MINTQRNRQIFEERFFEEKKFREIAEKYNLSCQTVMMICESEVRKIKNDLRKTQDLFKQIEVFKKDLKQLFYTVNGFKLNGGIPIDSLEISARLANALKCELHEGAFLDELTNLTPSDVKRIPNLGVRSFNELVAVMAQYGLKLKEE